MRRLLLLLLALSWPAVVSAQSRTLGVLFGGYAFDQAARHQASTDAWLFNLSDRDVVRALVPFVGVSPSGDAKVGLGLAAVVGDDIGGFIFADARGYGYVGGARGGGADAGLGVCLNAVLIRGAYGWAKTDQPRRGGNASVAVLVRLATF